MNDFHWWQGQKGKDDSWLSDNLVPMTKKDLKALRWVMVDDYKAILVHIEK